VRALTHAQKSGPPLHKILNPPLLLHEKFCLFQIFGRYTLFLFCHKNDNVIMHSCASISQTFDFTVFEWHWSPYIMTLELRNGWNIWQTDLKHLQVSDGTIRTTLVSISHHVKRLQLRVEVYQMYMVFNHKLGPSKNFPVHSHINPSFFFPGFYHTVTQSPMHLL